MKLKPLMNTEYPEMDRYFNDGWATFIKGVIKEHDRKNRRLFKAVLSIKGEEFVKQVRKFQIKTKSHCLVQIVHQPIGMKIGDKRFPLIPYIWIEQKSDPDGGMDIRFCIQVKENKWLLFTNSTD